ncbi:hypothetical protein D7024_01085 [Desulfofundulus salinus]|uniref:Type II secretion system protein GspF domain-containing protein n=1 Tax=Desulfofundulus salinus TaxID=2419843 RepID=A0A494WR82_9FIRM|nr:hypothetical protein D7024_01085 [Desulfofundulus salinum]
MDVLTLLNFAAAGATVLAALILVFGPNLSGRTRSVRLKEHKTGKIQDLPVLLAGAAGCALVAYAVTGTVYFAAAASLGGFYVSRWWRDAQEARRKELLRAQFADVLQQLASAVRGGLNPYQALEDAVPNMPRPAKDIFFEVLRRTRTGQTIVQALDSVCQETDWEDLRVLTVGLSLYSRTGSDLAAICDHALEAYYERESFRAFIDAVTADSRMTLKILSGLPFLVVGFARAVNPAFAEPLFHTLPGSAVFVVCCAMIFLGNVVVKKMMAGVSQ